MLFGEQFLRKPVLGRDIFFGYGMGLRKGESEMTRFNAARFACLQLGLLSFWLPPAAAQPPVLVSDLTDAYNLLQGKYRPDCTPDGDVQTIALELNAIRSAVPSVANAHEHGSWVPQELLLSLTGLLPASATEEQTRSRLSEIALHPLATGIVDLDRLNRQFGAVRLKPEYLDDRVSILFSKPLDMTCVVEAYQSVLGDRVQLNNLYGDGDRIHRAQRQGEPIHYVLSLGSGDCPAGCTKRTDYYFNLYPEGPGFRIQQIDGPPLYHTLWGYPRRFPLRIFEGFDDLLRKTQSPDWSLRLHAVSALGNVYAQGGSGLGEDVIGDRRGDSDIVKRTAALTADIMKNRQQVKNLLEQRAAHDPDDDVRRAAKSALRAEEQRKAGRQ
jgi:hypothetical protein